VYDITIIFAYIIFVIATVLVISDQLLNFSKYSNIFTEWQEKINDDLLAECIKHKENGSFSEENLINIAAAVGIKIK
jgi:hypothetical protein